MLNAAKFQNLNSKKTAGKWNLISGNDTLRVRLHGEELRRVVVELLLCDVPHVLAMVAVLLTSFYVGGPKQFVVVLIVKN